MLRSSFSIGRNMFLKSKKRITMLGNVEASKYGAVLEALEPANSLVELCGDEIDAVAGGRDWSFGTSLNIVSAGVHLGLASGGPVGGILGGAFALGIVDGHNSRQ